MDLALTESELALRDSVRQFVRHEASIPVLTGLSESPQPWRRDWLPTFAAAGWLGLFVPGELGGAGATTMDMTVLMEELGRGPVPGPVLPSSVVSALLLRSAAAGPARDELLAGIAAGTHVVIPALREPGSVIGTLRPELAAEPGLAGLGGSRPGGPLPVIATGSHDTASAVVAVPARAADFAYISCGTWSLVGVELDQPVLTEASRAANFTNETGVDGTIRYLRNVMGLWLLQESVRTWSATGQRADLATLLDEAARMPPLQVVVDPDDPVFLPPGDMPARIAGAARRTGQRPPADPPAVVRCILDSLALAYRARLREVQELSGRAVGTVHVVGGGVRNTLLLQLTADACGLPVVAGPAEAAALGNILVQARTLGAAPGDLAGMRALLRATQPLRRFEPSGGAAAAWDAAAARIGT